MLKFDQVNLISNFNDETTSGIPVCFQTNQGCHIVARTCLLFVRIPSFAVHPFNCQLIVFVEAENIKTINSQYKQNTRANR